MAHIYRVTLLLLIAAGHINYCVRGLHIHLRPLFERISSGSNITLHCSFSELNDSKVRFKWKFNSNYNTSNLENISSDDNHFHQTNGNNWSNLTIINTNVNDSGWYFCEVIVEIPKLQTFLSSSGSQVIIEGNTIFSPNLTISTPTSNLSPPVSGVGLWIWLGAGVAVVIAVLLVLILWRRKRCLERKNPVYENTKPKPQRFAAKQSSPRPSFQPDQSKILTQNMATTPAMPARTHEKNRIYENVHPTTRSCGQTTAASRTCEQSESNTPAYENVRAAKRVRKHPNKARPKV